jgi:hypothetical protein
MISIWVELLTPTLNKKPMITAMVNLLALVERAKDFDIFFARHDLDFCCAVQP